MVLNDANIRPKLKSYLNTKFKSNLKIVEELSIHNGNAVADLVSIDKSLHCYEIKGETDNISRISIQGPFYDSTFSYLTLVTTNNHLKNAIKKTPPHWGIIEVLKIRGKIKFTHHRKAKLNMDIKIEKALLTLWKLELQNIYTRLYKKKPKKNLNRLQLIDLICKKATVNRLKNLIAISIFNRQLFR
ncbi:sce7726 family protein [Leptospira noguchii]|uniref:sce7726 family protein n=1 Tax=Leptospira noguchii TaxID=28182 RepID=UPI001FB5EAB6|nr:sce7726 family protein [Leptospira noguchii]UOG51004.1 sce7726 family protein [Leptospira noguchii]